MHAFRILFISVFILAGLAAGDHCCNSGTDDVDDFCFSQSTLDHTVVAFCCDDTDPNSGRGCDGNTNFPIGQKTSVAGAISCTSGGATGFLACSL
ncbi:hypothetical protein LX32DRAFT_711025 [Colletotrichum zoysiae]|uniref:Uncharacterized protein n=1 Tax=Colletotrichum zoysiae TaxID=1216348 RepID=A0AAD9H441_9PEZI|nr:hypothetical protein LX32DRAFT_711025 [Colletotrichum zoysiae]